MPNDHYENVGRGHVGFGSAEPRIPVNRLPAPDTKRLYSRCRMPPTDGVYATGAACGLSTRCWNFLATRVTYRRMLTRFARALLVLTAFLALQASVLGGAAACALPGHAAMSGSAGPSPDGTRGTTPTTAVQAGSASMDGMAMDGASSADGDVPCEHGTAPSNCAAMPVCSVFAGPFSSRPREPGMIATRVAAMVALAPPSPTIVPELPPPRA